MSNDGDEDGDAVLEDDRDTDDVMERDDVRDGESDRDEVGDAVGDGDGSEQSARHDCRRIESSDS
jgi:hypothetical protein